MEIRNHLKKRGVTRKATRVGESKKHKDMACRTASVKRVADKTVSAKAQIDKLQAMIESQEAANKAKFFKEIDSHLSSAKIKDAREISYNSDIKTEYTSEFSLDKIAKVVISSLNAAVAATDPTVPNPSTSPEAIEAYTDVVNSVAEAAKSSSTASASLSFSMNRLSPGMFVFLYASSINIQDDETFGKEAVTTTAIYYRLMQSIDDVKIEAAFGAALIDAKNYLNMKTIQAALTDDLSNGKIDIDTWMAKDAAYSKAIQQIKARLDAAELKSGKSTLSRKAVAGSKENQQLVLAAISKLSKMGDTHKVVIEKSQERLANTYF